MKIIYNYNTDEIVIIKPLSELKTEIKNWRKII